MGLDQYAYEKIAETGEEGKVYSFQWRKHASLQEFMEQLFEYRTGLDRNSFNCSELALTSEDIADLRAMVTSGHLPNSAGGPFFGHQFQAESCREYRSYDLEFCNWAEARIADGATVCYSCWW